MALRTDGQYWRSEECATCLSLDAECDLCRDERRDERLAEERERQQLDNLECGPNGREDDDNLAETDGGRHVVGGYRS